ncbi:MAG: 4Fe-4S binding protein [Spirochaetales bacterium]|nr:4Fe-4S binding protein [Spirochaetales bacterium]
MERLIIEIDEELCNGCGACIPGCHEGALQILDGKARLVGDALCDGLGACLGDCPQGALRVVNREAEAFREELATVAQPKMLVSPPTAPGCPGSRVRMLGNPSLQPSQGFQPSRSALQQWPVQWNLVPVSAPFLEQADLLLCADCVPFAYADFHRQLLPGHVLMVGCPKFDDVAAYSEKLTRILQTRTIRSITVVKMDVPCCSGIAALTKRSLSASGKNLPYAEVTVTVDGHLG